MNSLTRYSGSVALKNSAGTVFFEKTIPTVAEWNRIFSWDRLKQSDTWYRSFVLIRKLEPTEIVRDVLFPTSTLFSLHRTAMKTNDAVEKVLDAIGMVYYVIWDIAIFPIRLLVGVVQVVTGLRAAEQKPDLIQWAQENERLMTDSQKVAFYQAAISEKVFRLAVDYQAETEECPDQVGVRYDQFERKFWLIPGYEGTCQISGKGGYYARRKT